MTPEITVGIPYTVDTGEKLINETFGPNNIRQRKTGNHQLMPMAVRNGRLFAGRIALDEHGFVFAVHAPDGAPPGKASKGALSPSLCD